MDAHETGRCVCKRTRLSDAALFNSTLEDRSGMNRRDFMGTVAGSFWADPIWVIEVTAFAFAVFFALLGVTVLIFRKCGHERAFALGLMVSQRNMGLMLAATNGVLPGTTWLYFALSQFPVYLTPLLLKPIVRRLNAPKVEPTAAG